MLKRCESHKVVEEAAWLQGWEEIRGVKELVRTPLATPNSRSCLYESFFGFPFRFPFHKWHMAFPIQESIEIWTFGISLWVHSLNAQPRSK